MDENLKLLIKLVKDMDVPGMKVQKLRHPDPEMMRFTVRWFNRNLGIRNSEHPNFKSAQKIIKQLIISFKKEEV